MLRSRDIPESKSASESDPYSDFEIVCPSRQPRRACLCAIVATGALSLWGFFAKYNGTRAFDCLVHCAERSSLWKAPSRLACFAWNGEVRASRASLGTERFVGVVCFSYPRHEVRLANLLNLSI